MDRTTKKFVLKTFPNKADWIINHSMSEQRLRDSGIKLKKDEIFVQYPRWVDYYGSNYGRCISVKYGKINLLKPIRSSNGYLLYSLKKPGIIRNGTKYEGDCLSISANRLVGDIFLPNYWPTYKRADLQVHHLDHNKRNNKWTNLILVPTRLHNILNKIDKIYLFTGKAFRIRTPYQIQQQTGMTLEEIILPLRQKPDKLAYKNDRVVSLYDISGFFIGYTKRYKDTATEQKKVV